MLSEIIYEPYVNNGWDTGYTRVQVAGGPNKGLWYITGTTLVIECRSVISRFCKAGAGNLPPPNEGWVEHNVNNVGQDPNGQPFGGPGWLNNLVDGLKAHENVGIAGNPKGRQQMLIDEYAKGGYDPRHKIEPLVGQDEPNLKDLVRINLAPLNIALARALAGPSPTGNWGPKYCWAWNGVWGSMLVNP